MRRTERDAVGGFESLQGGAEGELPDKGSMIWSASYNSTGTYRQKLRETSGKTRIGMEVRDRGGEGQSGIAAAGRKLGAVCGEIV